MPPALCPWVYLNGEFVAVADARVPVLDRGFLFGDAVYEVVPVHDGQAFAPAPHFRRLQRSLAAIDIPCPLDEDHWNGLLATLIERNGGGDLKLYLQITRGVMDGRHHAIPAGLEPTVVAFCQPLPATDPALLSDGAAAITAADIRWQRCDIKATALLANVLLTQMAVAAGANEAILHRDGRVTEGASSNVFVVSAGRIHTPPLDHWILGGITREQTLAAIAAEGLSCSETAFDLQTLRTADEIWLTSATREILAVTRLDGAAVGDGRPGPLWRRVLARLAEQH